MRPTDHFTGKRNVHAQTPHRRYGQQHHRRSRRAPPPLEVETPDKSFHPKEGEILDQRYTFVTRLGAGGNGKVWQVKERLPDDHSTRAAAIKLLKREISEDEQRVQRFKNEISIAYRFMHPHVIRTTHWGEIGGQFYAVMDYIDGETLREFIAGRHFTDEATARYLGQVAEALLRVLHSDKPALSVFSQMAQRRRVCWT